MHKGPRDLFQQHPTTLPQLLDSLRLTLFAIDHHSFLFLLPHRGCAIPHPTICLLAFPRPLLSGLHPHHLSYLIDHLPPASIQHTRQNPVTTLLYPRNRTPKHTTNCFNHEFYVTPDRKGEGQRRGRQCQSLSASQ